MEEIKIRLKEPEGIPKTGDTVPIKIEFTYPTSLPKMDPGSFYFAEIYVKKPTGDVVKAHKHMGYTIATDQSIKNLLGKQFTQGIPIETVEAGKYEVFGIIKKGWLGTEATAEIGIIPPISFEVSSEPKRLPKLSEVVAPAGQPITIQAPSAVAEKANLLPSIQQMTTDVNKAISSMQSVLMKSAEPQIISQRITQAVSQIPKSIRLPSILSTQMPERIEMPRPSPSKPSSISGQISERIKKLERKRKRRR